MALSSVPKKLSDDIINELTYTIDPTKDEFTLNDYYYKLRNIQNIRPLNEEECIALGLVLFNLKKYREFLDYMESTIRNRGTLDILGNYMMGKLMLITKRRLPKGDFDIQAEWFDHKLNQNCSPPREVSESKLNLPILNSVG